MALTHRRKVVNALKRLESIVAEPFQAAGIEMTMTLRFPVTPQAVKPEPAEAEEEELILEPPKVKHMPDATALKRWSDKMEGVTPTYNALETYAEHGCWGWEKKKYA
jgi:ribosomal protein L23